MIKLYYLPTFVIKETVENGTGRKIYDDLMHTLLTTKPNSFFENGYLADFFIVDQACSFKDPKVCNKILCCKDYLSTWTMTIYEKLGNVNIGNRDIFQIA